MKKFCSHLFNQVAVVLATSFLCLNLAACNNFLNGKEVKNEIESAIAYNNAKSLNVVISCPEDMGTVYPRNEYSVKLGFDFELQFKPNTDDYRIKDPATVFEAVKYSDQTISMSDYVEFTAIPQTQEDERDGLYRVKAQVVKESTDILIRPKCLLIPAVERIITDTKSGSNYVSSPIVVKFNTVMDINELNFTNIELTYNGLNVSQYFENPVLDEQNTILTIRTKCIDFYNFLEKIVGHDVIDIKVSFKDSIIAKVDDLSIPLKQNELSTFNVFYKKEKEEIPPDCYQFFMTNSQITLDDAASLDRNSYFLELFTNDNDKRKNRTKGVIFFYGHYFDDGSGVRFIKVKRTKTHDLENNELNENPITYVYYNGSNNAKFISDINGNTNVCIRHEIQDEDGTYEFEIIAEDGCEKQSAVKSITVFKENSLYGFTLLRNSINDPLNQKQYEEGLKTIWTKEIMGYDPYAGENEYGLYCWGPGKIQYSFKDCKLKYIYTDKFGKEHADSFIYNQDKTNCYFTIEDVDNLSGLPITIIAQNDFGTELIEYRHIPSEPLVVKKEERWEDNYEIHFDSYTRDTQCNLYYYSEDENENITFNKLYVREYPIIQAGTTYYCFMNNNGINGPYGIVNVDTPLFVIGTGPINISKVDYEMIDNNPERFNITITLNSEEWNEYKEIYMESTRGDFKGKKYFDKTTNSISFNSNCNFFVYRRGLLIHGEKKDGTWVEYTYDVSALDDDLILQKDAFPPQIIETKQIRESQEDCITIKIRDLYSGIKNVTVSFANSEYPSYVWDSDSPNPKDGQDPSQGGSLNISESSYCDIFKKYMYERWVLQDTDYVPFIETTIPLWQIAENGGIYINATDKSGNSMPQQYYFPDLNCYGRITSPNHSYYSINVNYFDEQPEGNSFELCRWDNNEWKYLASTTGSSFSTGSGIQLDKFYKMCSEKYYCIPYIYYKTNSYTGLYDDMRANEANNKAVHITSDAPVYVCTYSASSSYEDCKDWDINFWEQCKRVAYENVISFNSSHEEKLQLIDPDDKVPDWHCYVIMAYFASGKKTMSPVYIKDW